MTGPLVLSITRRRAAASSLSDVRGMGAAVTWSPWFRSGRMTLLQQDPSAQAACTSTAVTFLREKLITQHPYLPGAERPSSQGNLLSQRQSLPHVSRWQNVPCPETGPSHAADLSYMPPPLQE